MVAKRIVGARMSVFLVSCLPLLLAAVPPSVSLVADAAMRDDAQAVRSLLKQGKDVNAAQGDGMTALHWAATNGDANVAQMLIYAGANLEAVTRVGDYTPLHLASKSGNAAVVETLVKAGSDLGATTTTGGGTPLHFAAAAGSVEAIGVLLDHGAEIDTRETAWGQTPLMFAAAQDRVDATRLLLQRGADAAVTMTAFNIPERDEADKAAKKRRDERLAALRALEADTDESADREVAERAETAEPEKEAEATEADTKGGQAAESEEAETGDDPEPPAAEIANNEAEEDPEDGGQAERKPPSYEHLVGNHGGLTSLLIASRDGYTETAEALFEAGADVNQVSAGDHTSPLLIAAINGHFDLAMQLLERGADPNLASDAGTTPLYAALNVVWAPKASYPQQTAYKQQQTSYLELMEALLEVGADPNARLKKHLWFMNYNFNTLDIETKGATPFWRAAYATDVDAMKLLVACGADPDIPTQKVPKLRRYADTGDGEEDEDFSGLLPVPDDGPAVHPIHAASGVGYGESYAANSHRHVPDGWIRAVRYLVEELGADVNVRDHNGYAPAHHAAARGDNEMIRYLVEKGANVTLVSRLGQTTADMANGPVQRIRPFPETVALLESLGATNNHNCVSC